MRRPTSMIHHALLLLGISSLSVAVLAGCASQPMKTAKNTMPETQIAEVEAGDDPELPASESAGPEDCVENDERPACNIKPRGLSFIPMKIKSERQRNRCLRPAGGSTNENVVIILSTCSNTKSRRWFKKPGPFAGYRLENMNSGKCIQRVGNQLRQRTCAPSTRRNDAKNQMWKFKNTPPFGSGDLLQSWTAQEGCIRANNAATVQIADCQNDSNQRWYQSAF